MKNLLVYVLTVLSNTVFCLYDYRYTHVKNTEKYKEEYTIKNRIHHLLLMPSVFKEKGYNFHYCNKNFKLFELQQSNKINNPTSNYRTMETLIQKSHDMTKTTQILICPIRIRNQYSLTYSLVLKGQNLSGSNPKQEPKFVLSPGRAVIYKIPASL